MTLIQFEFCNLIIVCSLNYFGCDISTLFNIFILTNFTGVSYAYSVLVKNTQSHMSQISPMKRNLINLGLNQGHLVCVVPFGVGCCVT